MISMTKKLNHILQLNQKDNDLPLGYKQCEFLRSTGEQIIETDLLVNNNLSLFIKFRLPQKVTASSTNTFIAAYYEESARYRPIKLENGMFKIQYMNTATAIASIPQDTNIHTVLYNDQNGNCSFDEKNIGNIYKSINRTNDVGLGLFGQTLKTASLKYATTSLSKVEIYSVIAYQKSTNKVIEEYIPCLDRNGTPCMFGKKSWRPYYDMIQEKPFEYKIANVN